jgi:predicted polyphosphate/ATP-dependent NAD kinase
VTGPIVGIIANPVSARDIRRIISHAGNLQITDRANILLRILAGLAATGVQQVVMMPENAGIYGHLRRALNRQTEADRVRFPQLQLLDMTVTGGGCTTSPWTRGGVGVAWGAT